MTERKGTYHEYREYCRQWYAEHQGVYGQYPKSYEEWLEQEHKEKSE